MEKRDPVCAHLRDLAVAAARSGLPRYTKFLEPPQAMLAERMAREAGAKVEFFGGYADAERVVGGFYLDDVPDGWPVLCAKAVWRAEYGAAAHRDLLGAEMALGLDRACFGDIVVADDCAYLFLLDSAWPLVCEQLESAGRARLRLCLAENVDSLPPPKGSALRVTVPSLRLDALVAAAYKLGRAEAQSLIERGLVKRNHIESDSPSLQLREGDVVSVRGYGRFRLREEQGETKKGRLGVVLFRYGA